MSLRASFREVKPGRDKAPAKQTGKRSREADPITLEPRRAPPTLTGTQHDATCTVDYDIPEEERMLRAFDLTSKYGPCHGITRMERWERAHKFGLDPPPSVRDLLVKVGPEHPLNQGIWAGRV